MRASRVGEIYSFLGSKEEGFLWKELISVEKFTNQGWKRCFPRKTLDRHLKTLMGMGFVKKVPLVVEKRKRGRPSSLYRCVEGGGAFTISVDWRGPGKIVDGIFLPGIEVRNPHYEKLRPIYFKPFMKLEKWKAFLEKKQAELEKRKKELSDPEYFVKEEEKLIKHLKSITIL